MFDQFTGATITPRAVVKAVKKAAIYFKLHQKTLFSSDASCRSQEESDIGNTAISTTKVASNHG
jgi:electron transport complex protein RnfG